MALKKAYNFKGVTAEYWRIFNTVVNHDLGEEGQTRLTLALYQNAESRADSKDHKLFQTAPIILNGVYEDRASMYEALKSAETELDTYAVVEAEEPEELPEGVDAPAVEPKRVRVLFFADAEDV